MLGISKVPNCYPIKIYLSIILYSQNNNIELFLIAVKGHIPILKSRKLREFRPTHYNDMHSKYINSIAQTAIGFQKREKQTKRYSDMLLQIFLLNVQDRFKNIFQSTFVHDFPVSSITHHYPEPNESHKNKIYSILENISVHRIGLIYKKEKGANNMA